MNATIEAALLSVELDENFRLLFIDVLEESIRQQELGNAELADKLEQFTYAVIVPAWEQAVNLFKEKPKRRAKAK
jgi:hypothetical protein